MPNTINLKQIEAIKKLSNRKRYEHLIKQIADTEEVWTIKMDDGYFLQEDEEGNQFIPIWPHPEYIKEFQTDEWKNGYPEMIHLHDWIEKWLPGMIMDKKKISVFPTCNQKNCVVSPEEFNKDLLEELNKYE